MTDLILSRQLGSIADIFERHAPNGLHWDPLSAGQFAGAMRLLAGVAQTMEADVDRLRWENSALKDPQRNGPDVMAKALAEIERMIRQGPSTDGPGEDALILKGVADGSVSLFPIVKRAAFGDGREPSGGAA